MNRIILSGIVENVPELSHEFMGEKFYRFDLMSERKSGTKDILPCSASEVFLDKIKAGNKIEIEGSIRTRNYDTEEHGVEKSKMEIMVFVDSVNKYSGMDRNEVSIDGFVCKNPIYRKTPLGREITDILLASNRERHHKSDYIPAIAWGRSALKASEMKIGTRVDASGRLQSREYTKITPEGNEVVKVAYELSLFRVTEMGYK